MLRRSHLAFLATLLLFLAASAASGIRDQPCVPITGSIRPELAAFDAVMLELICDEDITAAVMGMMIDGRIVAQRGYGWVDEARTKPLPPDALIRIASITKPLVAAVVRELIDDGLLALDTRAFDFDGPVGGAGDGAKREPGRMWGVLPVEPFPALGDERLRDITIEHLLLHQGGWDRSEAGDLTYREIAIARAMDVPCPPGRLNTVRYILGQPLQFDPGSKSAYSNIGYLVLGLIVEHITGEDLVDVIHARVLEPLGVKRTELLLGRTFREDQCEREPPYGDEILVPNVFDPGGQRVARPYGGWHHEARVGQGGLITTTETLLKVLAARYISGPDIGRRRTGDEGANWRRNHGGALRGLNAIARQRGDGVNFVIIVNRNAGNSPSYSERVRVRFDERIDAMPGG